MKTNRATDTSRRGFGTVDAGHYIGRSASWLRKKRMRGALDPGDPGPRFRRTAGGFPVYLREDLDSWLEGKADE
jgi:hypothetical protein